MMSATIERLITLFLLNANKLVPTITGPGACKTGIICHIGGLGYPQEGKHTGYGNRNITMIGNYNSAQSKSYIRRSVAADSEGMSKMNQTHYLSNEAAMKMPNDSCLSEINRTISQVDYD